MKPFILVILFLLTSSGYAAVVVTADKLSITVPDDVFSALIKSRAPITTFALSESSQGVMLAAKERHLDTGRPTATLNCAYLPLGKDAEATKIDRDTFLKDTGKDISEGKETSFMINNILGRKIIFENYDLGENLSGTRYYAVYQPLDKSVALVIDGYYIDSASQSAVEGVLGSIQNSANP